MDFLLKIRSRGNTKSVFELRNTSVKCISRFQHRHGILFVLGANMAPCWLPKGTENPGLEGVWASPRRYWEFPGGIVGIVGKLQEGMECQKGCCNRFSKSSGKVLERPGAAQGSNPPRPGTFPWDPTPPASPTASRASLQTLTLRCAARYAYI